MRRRAVWLVGVAVVVAADAGAAAAVRRRPVLLGAAAAWIYSMSESFRLFLKNAGSPIYTFVYEIVGAM